MSLFAESIKKIHIENLMSYLFYGKESLEHILQEEEKRLDSSYLEIHSALDRFYGKDRKEEEISGTWPEEAVKNFASVHDDIYFEIGLFAGAEMSRRLLEGYQSGKEGMECLLKKSNRQKKRDFTKTVLREMVDERMDTGLEQTLRDDSLYRESRKNYQKALQALDEGGFTPQQARLVEQALTENNDQSADYGRLAYLQAVKDLLYLLQGAL